MLVKAGIIVSSEVNPEGHPSDTAFRPLTTKSESWIWQLYATRLCFVFVFYFFLPKIQQNFLLVSASLGWFMEMLRVPSSRRQHLQQWDIFREWLLLTQENREWPQQMGKQYPVTPGSHLAFAEPPFLRLPSPEHTGLHGWGKKWDIVLWVEIIYGHY